jgi:hypothetical protein
MPGSHTACDRCKHVFRSPKPCTTSRVCGHGAFPHTEELVAGFWLWEVHSIEEAIDWVKRCPNPTEGESEIEIRLVAELEDFGANATPELHERQERLGDAVRVSR